MHIEGAFMKSFDSLTIIFIMRVTDRSKASDKKPPNISPPDKSPPTISFLGQMTPDNKLRANMHPDNKPPRTNAPYYTEETIAKYVVDATCFD